MIDFTTFLAVDKEHLAELQTNWPFWVLHKPEILSQPLFVARDSEVSVEDLAFLEHPDMKSQEWTYPPPASQREKMLASFVLLAPKVVETPWILKLDTDTLATNSGVGWCGDNLVEGNPVLISNPSPFVDPPDPAFFINKWVTRKNPSGLVGTPPVTIPLKEQDRITSWLFFGRTDWCKTVADIIGDKLPYPSHDIMMWYMAKRLGVSFHREDMSQYGWQHGRTVEEKFDRWHKE